MSQYNPIQTHVRPFCLKLLLSLEIYYYGSKWTIKVHYTVNWADLVYFTYCSKSPIKSPKEPLNLFQTTVRPFHVKFSGTSQNLPLHVQMKHKNPLQSKLNPFGLNFLLWSDIIQCWAPHLSYKLFCTC